MLPEASKLRWPEEGGDLSVEYSPSVNKGLMKLK